MANKFWVGGTATWNGTAGTKWASSSGGTGNQPIPTTSDAVFFDNMSGSGTVTIGASSACASLDTSSFGGTIAGATALAISAGDLKLGGNWTYTGTLSFPDTSGTTRVITSNSVALVAPISITGVGGVVQLADALSTTKAITHTNGTFDTNGKTVSALSYTASGTAARTLMLGNSQFTVTNTAVAWSVNVTTFTLTTGGASKIIFTGSSSQMTTGGGTLTYDDISVSENGNFTFSGALVCRDVTLAVTGGSSNVVVTTTLTCRNLDWTGTTASWSGASGVLTMSGNLTLAAGMTNSNTSGITFSGTSGTQIVTSNGIALASTIAQSGAGGTTQLADTFSTTKAFTLNAGTFDTNGKACTASGVNLTGATTTRAMTLGASIVTVTGAGTNWTNSGDNTGLTFTAGTSNIKLTDATASTKTFAGGGLTYYDMTITGAGTGAYTVSGSNSWNSITIDTPPHTVNFTASTTQTFTGPGLVATGTAGNLITVQSGTGGTAATLTKVANDVTCDFLSVQDITFTGGARWFLGRNSTNTSGNNGGRFTAKYRSPMVLTA